LRASFLLFFLNARLPFRQLMTEMESPPTASALMTLAAEV
jgi:hypothetical protein